MMSGASLRSRGLACRGLATCHDYQAVAIDGSVGGVESLLYPPDVGEPDFLVIRTGGLLLHRRRFVAAELVEDVDPAQQLVYLSASRAEILALPVHLPLRDVAIEEPGLSGAGME